MTALVGDIGATNARFALVDAHGRLTATRVLACDEHDGVEALIRAYLAVIDAPRIGRAALGVPCPVHGDKIVLTNRDWRFSVRQLQRALRLEQLAVINDFAANALAAPALRGADRVQIGTGQRRVPGAPVGILGPGSGLGVASLLTATDGSPVVIPSEGGHATMAAADEFEARVLDLLRSRRGWHGHVSAERVLSGPGLVNLYQAIRELQGDPPLRLLPRQITEPGADDPARAAAVRMFCAMLGTVAGNLALTLDARGGVYVAGGIVPRLGVERFRRSHFRRRFEAKGRFRDTLRTIPTYLMVHPMPALLGLAKLLSRET